MEEQEKGNSNKKEEQKKSKKNLNGVISCILLGICFLFIAYQVYIPLNKFPVGQILAYIIGFFALVCFMASISGFLDYKESRKIEQLEEDALREEQEFSKIDLAERALRAEKMFRMNQKELMRYYDMNLAQTKFLSLLGILMITFGVLTVAASLCIYIAIDADKTLLFVGSISGIIVDFIGAIFIKMYTKNIEAAVKFHAKFADSNNLLLANSIANKIENEQIRETTLSENSKNIVFYKQDIIL